VSRYRATRIPHHPTILDVARAAGVSKSTVSNVLREAPDVATGTRQRVLEAIAHVGYRPNALARNLVRRRTTTVGIIVGDLANPFYSELAKLAEQRLAKFGFATMICNTDGLQRNEQEKIEMLLEHRVAGILMLQFTGRRSILEKLRDAGVAVVIASQWEPRVDCVDVDERAGAELAVSHLLELAHRRVAYLSSNFVERRSERARLAGYSMALRKAAVQYDPKLVVRLRHPASLRSDNHLRRALEALLALDKPPTAIFASNDLVAVDLLETAEELGLGVPRDLSVVGFDDILVAGLARISLTTVVQPREELAAIAIDLLGERIEEGAEGPPRRRLLPPLLVVRGSTASRASESR
jgi:LacI family transcriptional regulator, galactose operon repressor